MDVRARTVTAEPIAGDIIAGKYRVERVVGRGGMGYVLAVEHVELEEKVALKLLRQDIALNDTQLARFMREGRTASKIKSSHVARVFDVGRTEDGLPFLVMELLEGQDLAELIHEGRPLPTASAVDYVLEACEAIAEAHAIGIVHRDLKPSNLFLAARPDGTAIVKVLDFGISKVASSEVTQTSDAMGSPAYMSPEQLKSARDVDARADIWSLGVILYELCCARLPFSGETIGQMCTSILTSSPHDLRVELPRGFDAVVLRCLEKNCARRYASILELARELVPFGGPNAAAAAQAIERVAVRNEPRSDPSIESGPRTPRHVAAAFAPTQADSELAGTLAAATGDFGARPRATRKKTGIAALGVLSAGLLGVWLVARAPVSGVVPITPTSAPPAPIVHDADVGSAVSAVAIDSDAAVASEVADATPPTSSARRSHAPRQSPPAVRDAARSLPATGEPKSAPSAAPIAAPPAFTGRK